MRLFSTPINNGAQSNSSWLLLWLKNSTEPIFKGSGLSSHNSVSISSQGFLYGIPHSIRQINSVQNHRQDKLAPSVSPGVSRDNPVSIGHPPLMRYNSGSSSGPRAKPGTTRQRLSSEYRESYGIHHSAHQNSGNIGYHIFAGHGFIFTVLVS